MFGLSIGRDLSIPALFVREQPDEIASAHALRPFHLVADKTTNSEIRLPLPRCVSLSAAQYDEAVSLLAELLLEAFCKVQEGWRIVAHKQDQASGTKLDRPGLQAALELARAGAIDTLLVYRVDRLSRKVRQLAQLAEELDAVDVVLRSATEPFDTGSAAGRMMLQMLAVFAEFEHATIVDRISAGIERRAKEGRWFGGRPPFGYQFSNE